MASTLIRRWILLRLICAGPTQRSDARELAERYETAPGTGYFDLADLIERVAIRRLKPHLDEETLLPLEDYSDRLSSHRLYGIQDLSSVDAVAGDSIPKDPNSEIRKAPGLLRLHVRRARYPRHYPHDLIGLFAKDVQIAPVERNRDIRAHARDELLHPEFDGLRVAEDVAGNRLLERRIDVGDEVFAVARGRPLFSGLENDVDVAGFDPHRVGRDLGAPRSRDDGLDFRKPFEDVLDDCRAGRGLGERHAWKPPRLDRLGPLHRAWE